MALNLAPFYTKLDAAFGNALYELAAISTEQIEASQWDWPRATVRSDGRRVTAPRDIVDTGALRDSVVVELAPRRFEGAVGYAADYAIAVHEGEVVGGTLKPPRPWLAAAAESFDLAEFISKEMRP